MTKLVGTTISRRTFIEKAGSVGVISVVAPTVLFTQCYRPEWKIMDYKQWENWSPKTIEAFSESISWILRITLGIKLPSFGEGLKAAAKLAKELGAEIESDPKPTNDKFHNLFASNYIVTNERHKFSSRESEKFGYNVQLDHYIRTGDKGMLLDLSTNEIRVLSKISEKYGGVIFPTSHRREPTLAEFRAYKDVYRSVFGDFPSDTSLKYIRMLRRYSISRSNKSVAENYKAYGYMNPVMEDLDLLITN